jgi:uncharacterized protein involved in response to NO
VAGGAHGGITGPYACTPLLDLLLLPVVAAVFVAVLVRARNRRNLPLAGILLLLALANAASTWRSSALSPCRRCMRCTPRWR